MEKGEKEEIQRSGLKERKESKRKGKEEREGRVEGKVREESEGRRKKEGREDKKKGGCKMEKKRIGVHPEREKKFEKYEV